jgi:hypothetical protein
MRHLEMVHPQRKQPSEASIFTLQAAAFRSHDILTGPACKAEHIVREAFITIRMVDNEVRDLYWRCEMAS